MFRKIKPLDLITFTHIFINSIILFIGWNKLDNSFDIYFKYLIITTFILILMKYKKKSSVIRVVYDWYPLLLWGFFFEATTQMSLVIWNNYWDVFIQKIDQFIFGYQPAMEWGIKFSSYFLQEFFHFWYISYYFMILGIGILFYVKDRKLFHKYFFGITFVFYMCYLTYLFVPVIGGRFWDVTLSLSKEFRFGIFTRSLALIYNKTAHWGGAIPSSHVAVATAVTIASYQYKKILGWLLLPATILICISTVYCHYHYFIDTPVGILYGVVFYYLGLKIYKKMVSYV